MNKLFPILFFIIFIVSDYTKANDLNDPLFNAQEKGENEKFAGFNAPVLKTVLLNNGQILCLGEFTKFGSKDVKNIAILNSDGSLNTNFNFNNTLNGQIYDAVFAKNNIFLVGSFTLLNGKPQGRILKLKLDGSVDEQFNLASNNTGFNNTVNTIAVDNSFNGDFLLVGGVFTQYGSKLCNKLIRISQDGEAIDDGFSNALDKSYSIVNHIAVHSPGDITIIADVLTIIQLDKTGKIDPNFNFKGKIIGGMTPTKVLKYNFNEILILGNFSIEDNITKKNHYGIALIDRYGNLKPDFNSPFTKSKYITTSYKDVIVKDNYIYVAGMLLLKESNLETNLIRCNLSGEIDTTFNYPSVINGPYPPFIEYNVNSILNVNNEELIIAGYFSTYQNNPTLNIAKINNNGDFISNFKPFDSSINLSFNDNINDIHIQRDKKVIVAGTFTSYFNKFHNGIIRINENGDVDNTFYSGLGVQEGMVSCVTTDSLGKIYLAGNFKKYNNTNCGGFIKLNQDGSVDSSFNIPIGIPPYFTTLNNVIEKVIVQKDGKILLAGRFTSFNNINSKQFIVRLNPDGTIDNSFNIDAEFNSISNYGINDVVILKDDKYLIVGNVNITKNKYSYDYVFKLNFDGTLDTTFKKLYLNNWPNCASRQNDGKILISGLFNWPDDPKSNPYKYLIRIYPDGTIDTTFKATNAFNNYIYKVKFQNNKIYVAGDFNSYQNINAPNLAVLNNNGTLNSDFELINGISSSDLKNSSPIKQGIRSLAVSDSIIYVGGQFTNFNNKFRSRITKLIKGFNDLYFKDNNLKTALVNHVPKIDTNHDGEISYEEALAVTKLNLSNQNITTFPELVYFPNVDTLIVTNNQINNLNLHDLTQLQYLDANQNQLSSIDFTKNDSLKFVNISNNQINTIQYNTKHGIQKFWANNNQITDLDFSGFNQLKLSAEGLKLNENPLQKICVNKQQVQDNQWTYLPQNLVLDTICGENFIHFPDKYFKDFMIICSNFGQGWDVNKDGEISFNEAKLVDKLYLGAFGGVQYCNDTANWVRDIKGIAYFDNLNDLFIGNSFLEKIELNNLKKLQFVSLINSPIDSIILKGLDKIVIVSISEHQVSYLEMDDVVKNHINEIQFKKSSLTNYDITDFTNLTRIYVEDENMQELCVSPDQITSITWDIPQNLKLNTYCGSNIIQFNNPKLKQAIINHQPPVDTNKDGEISYNEALQAANLVLSNLGLTDLTDLINFANLINLNISFNDLVNIDISAFTQLQSLIANNNQIKNILFFNQQTGPQFTESENIQNITLTNLVLNNNDLRYLDVNNLTNLQNLQVNENPNLKGVCVNQNQLDNWVNVWDKDAQAIWSTNCDEVTSSNYIQQNLAPAYPNPAQNYIYINAPATGIFDINGKLVQNITSNAKFISLQLSPGLYFIQYQNGKVEKLIVQ